MSLILDALRRKNDAEEPPSASPRRGSHADAVLATLGYSRVRRTHRAYGRLAAYAFAVVILGLSGWLLVDWVLAPEPPGPMTPVLAVQLPAGTTAPGAPPTVASPSSSARPSTATLAPPKVEPKPTVPTSAPVPPNVEPKPALPSLTPVSPPRENVKPAPPPTAPAVPAVRAGSEPDHFRLALYYQRAGDFENALLHYRAVLQQNELNAEVHNNLGLLYQEKGLLAEAVTEFERALFIDQRYVRAYNNLGVTFLSLNRFDQAAAQFRTALTLDPRNVDAMVNLAIALKSTGQADQARAQLLRALELDSHSAPSHYNLALLYEEAGETAKAIQHYRLFLQYGGAEHAHLAPGVRSRIDTLSARLR